MTTTARKFLFDLDFGRRQQPSSTSPNEEPQDLAASETFDAAYQTGWTEGQRAQRVEHDLRIEAALADILSIIQKAAGAIATEAARIEDEAVHLALTIARTFADQLVQRDEIAFIDQTVRRCFKSAQGAGQLSLTLHPDVADLVRTKMEAQAEANGFDGRILVAPSPTLHLGDVQIEWAGGGLDRNREALETLITTTIATHFETSHEKDGDLAS